ncbi:MAG: hypothetical protein BGO43_07740 [Gammaproteobacteria bacterium 39-13]|jgi:CRP/FNR family transcriptional regulator|nr:cyclic nucleotide-binding domain-containing protein [Gammaproteobacteria bacterium]OJV93059.1 MAG: hypothetical protein BGO43_07740 [Gammaproteobacteria bacterium 39-13]
MSVLEPSCFSCRLSTYCFPPGLDKDHLYLLDSLIDKQRLFHKNEYVYREKKDFTEIFIIRTGSVKTYNIANNGQIAITGFCYPGEILGMNAIAAKSYQENAVALDTVSVCALKYCEFVKLSNQFISFNQQLIKLMSEKLASQLITNHACSAESKIALFLLTISNKMKNYGTSGIDFSLSMSRDDIAKYLGLATETVSRILSKFKLRKILTCSNKAVHLQDILQLEILAAEATL